MGTATSFKSHCPCGTIREESDQRVPAKSSINNLAGKGLYPVKLENTLGKI
jgi:hypothetical protein